jgi:hypothetical protein
MTTSRDIESLFGRFGGDAADYQEVRAEMEADQARSRWPLLGSLDPVGRAEGVPARDARPFVERDEAAVRRDAGIRRDAGVPFESPVPRAGDGAYPPPAAEARAPQPSLSQLSASQPSSSQSLSWYREPARPPFDGLGSGAAGIGATGAAMPNPGATGVGATGTAAPNQGATGPVRGGADTFATAPWAPSPDAARYAAPQPQPPAPAPAAPAATSEPGSLLKKLFAPAAAPASDPAPSGAVPLDRLFDRLRGGEPRTGSEPEAADRPWLIGGRRGT